MAKIIDGKTLKEKILFQLKKQIAEEKIKPKLAIVQVGEDSASSRYIEQKIKAGEQIGAKVELFQLPKTTDFAQVEKQIEALNQDEKIKGIIIQLPLPKHLETEEVINLIDSRKDVDGLTKNSSFQPATPLGILELLKEYRVSLKGKKVVVVGQGRLVGAPLSDLLEREGALVTRIDINTPSPIELLVEQGDIVIAAVGKANLVTENMVKEGAVIIDAGTNIHNSKLVGDVDFERVSKKVRLITPVPGGVGPMTVAMLFSNLLKASTSSKQS